MLPDDIEKQILDYLHLEYGEDPGDSGSLELADIKYVGEKLVEGVVQHCWSYPSLKDDMWATVQLYEDGTYCIGMAPIPKKNNENNYEYLFLAIKGKQTKKIKIPYQKDEEYKICNFEDEFITTLENGKNLYIYSEVFLTPKPHQFDLTIDYDGQEIYLRGAVGIEFKYSLETEIEIYIDIGNLEWEE